MSASVVVGGVLFPANELLRVEELAVGPGTDLVDHGRFQIHKHAARNVLSSTSFAEEGIERIVATADSGVGGHHAVGRDAVLQAVQFPAGVADLAAGLADVNGYALPHSRFLVDWRRIAQTTIFPAAQSLPRAFVTVVRGKNAAPLDQTLLLPLEAVKYAFLS